MSGWIKLDRLTLVQGDDYPRLMYQLYELDDPTAPVDISASAVNVIVKMREQGETDILMMKLGTKAMWPNLGMFYLDWPATSLDQDDGNYELEFSVSQSSTEGVITGATQASPVVITDVAHGRTTGDIIHIYDVAGMTEINSLQFTITVIDVDSFSLDGIDGTDYTAYTSGGTWAIYAGIQTCLAIQPAAIKEDF